MKGSRLCFARWITCLLLPWSATASAGDWPQWRYDAGRGAATAEELPAELHLQWVRELPEPRPAWPPSQPPLRFDLSYSPVAGGGLLFFPSMVNDTVTAYDGATGAERWRFYGDGPVRFAPIADQDKVYFVADDGCLYCLDAQRGTLRWRFHGGPSERKVLGNERLISTWPARGGPVLHNGTIYFTAGIWPFMGIFVCAVDAQTGQAVWTNSGEGSVYIQKAERNAAFGGFAPCGYLAASRFGLMVPGGRIGPGCYDLKSGQLRYFDPGKKNFGAYQTIAYEQWFFHRGQMFAMADGDPLTQTSLTLHDQHALYGVARGAVVAVGLQPRESGAQSPSAQQQPVEKSPAKKKQDKKARLRQDLSQDGKLASGPATASPEPVVQELWTVPLAKGLPKRLFLKAGSHWIFGDSGIVAAVPIRVGAGPAKPSWQGTFEGEPWDMLVADGRLFVVTTAGRIYGFGARQCEPMTYPAPKQMVLSPRGDDSLAKAILAHAGVKDGYGIIFGLSRSGLAEGLLRVAGLRLIAVDPDPAKVTAARRRIDDMGLYGTRFSAHVGEPSSFALPPYLASLAVVEPVSAVGPDRGVELVRTVFAALRPYGGTALFEGLAEETLRQWVKQADLANARIEAGEAGSYLVRFGALPGAADWTHQYANAANSMVSQDRAVKAPLGLLWFGGPSNDEVLPRHGHGPTPQVAAGRLVIEGADMLRALDVYTGRLLWQKAFPSLGRFYDNTSHQPGASEIGSNYVTLPDGIYVVRGSAILGLDAATGEQKREFKAPPAADGTTAAFGFLAAWENLLVATARPVMLGTGGLSRRSAKPQTAGAPDEEGFLSAPYASSSRHLMAFDRHTGKLLWQRTANYAFRHNAIAIGAKRVFCIDGIPQAALSLWKRRGAEQDVQKRADYRPELLALDAQTGRELWSTHEDVFGTLLSYSTEYDALLQAGSGGRDAAADEAKTGMAAYRGADGKVLWRDLQRKYKGPCMLHHDTIITQDKAYLLLTGEPKHRIDPLTARQIEWGFERTHGCNTVIASEHLLTFRSSMAGYYDLARDGGTGNFGGFRSGCTSNLVVADGVLNAPEYTRTCSCGFANQTSLAMVHDPEAEMWTFNAYRWSGEPVRRVGINFGAPGDRMADNGTLWLDYPSQGGSSPDVPVEIQPAKPEYFRHHSARIKVPSGTAGLSWVAASGMRNVAAVTLTLSKEKSPRVRNYTVRLHFAEVEPVQPAERVFRVRLQGQQAGPEIDIAREVGTMRALVKEFRDVPVTDKLKLSFEPCTAGSLGAVLCGLEVVAQGW